MLPYDIICKKNNKHQKKAAMHQLIKTGKENGRLLYLSYFDGTHHKNK